MATSNSVTNHTYYPYENIMVIERRYEYIKGYDAKRKSSKSLKMKGWVYIGTEKDDFVNYGLNKDVGIFVLKEIYIKEGHVYKTSNS